MINKTIVGEEQFQVNAHSFAVSPSAEGYTLNYSADGVHFTAYEDATPADETLFVVDVPKGAFFKLVGNNSECSISW